MYVLIFGALALLILGGCALKGQVVDGDGMVRSYKQITQDEAKKMMEQEDGPFMEINLKMKILM